MKKTVLIHANYWDGERMCRDGRIEIADGYVDAVYGACDEQNLKPYNIEETCFEDMSGIYLFPAWIDSHLHIPGDFLFEKFGVFTKAELDSRVEIEYETYAKEINIEAKAMIDIATKQIIPAVIRYTTTLAQSINAVKAACGADISVQTEILMEVSDLLADTKNALSKLEEVTAQGAAMAQGREQAVFYRDEVMTAMKALRTPVDKLEMLVDKSMWPMPSYGDLMFEV